MSITRFKALEEKWANTKPIRGRSVDVRPIGERRRDWEQVTRRQLDEGMWSYSARLYGTDCVEYLPNGDVILRTNGWQTPSTAEFINTHSPFGCAKQYNKLWVDVRTEADTHPALRYKALPLGNEMRLNFCGNNIYKPNTPVMVSKKVINRVLAKAAREPLQPFLAWAKTFLKMSDGWVMHETRKEVLGWEARSDGAMMMRLAASDDRQVYQWLTEQADIEPEHMYLRAMCLMASKLYVDNRLAEVIPLQPPSNYSQRFRDYCVEYDTLKRKVYALVEKFENIHEVVQVEPGAKAMTGAI